MSEYKFTPEAYYSGEDLKFMQDKIMSLESQLSAEKAKREDLEKVLQWLFKSYDPDDFLEERNGDYRFLRGIKNYFAASPLECIQSAMKAETKSE